jgi:DNA-binding transcriptional LysR family regulator
LAATLPWPVHDFQCNDEIDILRIMHSIDLNLLVALDALLAEGSVIGAARRMNLSPPAMSRTLSRIRHALGDEILVRAGRVMVPTPRALEMHGRVRGLLEDMRAVLRPQREADPATLARSFTIRASDYVAGVFGVPLHSIAAREAPGVTLRFADQGKEDVSALREGRIDLDIGVIGDIGPEIRVQTLLRDHFVAVMRVDHPLGKGRLTARRYASALHVSASRRGFSHGPIDEALAALGLSRQVSVVVPGFHAAMLTAAASDFLASVPLAVAATAVRLGLKVRHVELPVKTPEVVIMQAWHPRFDKDAGHRWLRDAVRRALTDHHIRDRTKSPAALTPRRR